MSVEVQLERPVGGAGGANHAQPGTFIGKLSRITDAPPYENDKQMYWWWNLYWTGSGPKDLIDVAILDDGTPWEFRDKTSVRFGMGPNGPAKARERVEALLKREIKDDEPLTGILDECIGKPAILHLIEKKGGDGNMYLQVKFVEPYKSGTLCPAPADGEAAGDDDGDAPF